MNYKSAWSKTAKQSRIESLTMLRINRKIDGLGMNKKALAYYAAYLAVTTTIVYLSIKGYLK